MRGETKSSGSVRSLSVRGARRLTIVARQVGQNAAAYIEMVDQVEQNTGKRGILGQYVEHGEQAQRSNGGPIACFDRQAVRNAG